MAAIAAMLNKSVTKPSEPPVIVTEAAPLPEPKAKAKRKARPPKANPKSSIIHVRLRDDLLDNLKAKADQHDLSVSQLVRLVLQQAAANPKLTLKPVDNL
jgi:uncharacterized protein (DUF4415 family)